MQLGAKHVLLNTCIRLDCMGHFYLFLKKDKFHLNPDFYRDEDCGELSQHKFCTIV